MPGRKTHMTVGALVGGGAAAWAGRDQGSWQLVETCGGAVAGAGGGAFPDAIEPAVNAWHRSGAHSWTAAALLAVAVEKLGSWQAVCREASQHHHLAAQRSEGLRAFGHEVLAVLLRVAAGVVVGLPAGYLSHLLLDATTPRGLPLLGR